MFIRTPRLFLRPAWPEDAAAVYAAVNDWDVVWNLARAPWPYAMADAEAFVAGKVLAPDEASFLIWKRTDGEPVLVGSIGFGRMRGDAHELGYWIARDHWRQGFATEAGRAVLALAFEGLRLPRLTAAHLIDNPASGAVLRKLGFQRTGRVAPRFSRARGGEAPAADYELAAPEWRMRTPLALAA